MPERDRLEAGADEAALRGEIARQRKIIKALMDRAERSTGAQGSDFNRFQATVMLEQQVAQRTAQLDAALRENEKITRALLALQEQLREQSTHDALTGLYNRRYLANALENELLSAARRGHPLSLIMGDLDHFKAINDEHGHLAGDAVLRAFGALMRRHARGSDVCCRYGGEEFLLVLPQLARDGAVERAEQLRRALATARVPFGQTQLEVTASFGVSSLGHDGGSATELIRAADRALYAAKLAGRNRVGA
jgi:diguanylate cyclase (GGDEF)-like protein